MFKYYVFKFERERMETVKISILKKLLYKGEWQRVLH